MGKMMQFDKEHLDFVLFDNRNRYLPTLGAAVILPF